MTWAHPRTGMQGPRGLAKRFCFISASQGAVATLEDFGEHRQVRAARKGWRYLQGRAERKVTKQGRGADCP